MYWGKANATNESSGPAVFDRATDFAGVWHLDNSNNLADSTIRANTGSNGSSTTAQGIIGKCGEFFGGAKIHVPPAALSGIVGHATFSFWSQVTTNRIVPKRDWNTVFESLYTNGWAWLKVMLPNYTQVHWNFGDQLCQPIEICELPGTWINWVFTHNAGSGIMNIYRYGALWSTRNGATCTLVPPLATFTFGLTTEGRIDEF